VHLCFAQKEPNHRHDRRSASLGHSPFPEYIYSPAVHESESSLPPNPEGVSMLKEAAKKAAEGIKPQPKTSPLSFPIDVIFCL